MTYIPLLPLEVRSYRLRQQQKDEITVSSPCRFYMAESEPFIKSHGAGIAAPYIQCDIVAPAPAGVNKNVLIDRNAHMLAPRGLIHTNIVDIQRQKK